ncbi:MAG: glycosyltransferase family 39 protein [Proteobacteria bacterium]|nr:glycosyltransferase family 39 protein [Pseudomonadota bacterium]
MAETAGRPIALAWRFTRGDRVGACVNTATRPLRGRLALAILVALAPLWLVGMFGRGLWTPDEPREADIAWRMSQPGDHVLPQLAGTPFLEKPPLSYWVSGAAIAAWGDTPGSARAPNLLYAAVGTIAIAALLLALGAGAAAALPAALVAGSAVTALRVAIWLAPDAALVCGSSLALLGAWRGYTAPRGRRKAWAYALMHLGAAMGFMAKSAPGWLLPALTLLALMTWERRWRELVRWELYAGLALQVLLIAPWIAAVAHAPEGEQSLRALFWHNVVGRFTHVAGPQALDYTTGHPNSPGKYLLELPVYLLPWTLLVIAALARAWGRVRGSAAGAVRATAWRFALCACLPFLLLLSLAATARDIYIAPALPGFALLVGLWLDELRHPPSRLDRLALTGTQLLAGVIAGALLVGLLVLALSGEAPVPACAGVAIAVAVAAGVALLRARTAQRQGRAPATVAWTYSAFAAAVSLGALVVFPVIDRGQDLAAVARQVHADTAQQSLALLDPDETTVAILDHGLRTPFTILANDGRPPGPAVSEWFLARGAQARVLVLLPGRAGGSLSRWSGHADTRGDGIAAQLEQSGRAVIERRYQLPQGRRYALLAPRT